LRAWETTGANLASTIKDLTNGNDHHTMHDEPGRNHWSCVGLLWSSTQQQITLDDASTSIVATVVSSSDAAQAVLHFHIQWRFAGRPQPTASSVFA
jgi:hypothetical protein